MKFNPKNIRIWNKNPRYTLVGQINFNEIGKEDFEETEFKKFKDIYFNNLEENYLKLIKNEKQLKSFIDLLESLSNGYDENIDQIIVVTSPYLKQQKIFNDKINGQYIYALEGNRRIFALNILNNFEIELDEQNTKNIRNIFIKYVEKNFPNYLKKINQILNEFDASNIDLSEIDVKILDISEYNSDDLWKTLNARHFGNRKGKLNWPRGLVLQSIFEKVKDTRNKLNYTENQKMDDKDYKKMCLVVENFTGKNISERDLKSSLLAIQFINIYNEHNPDSKIKFEHTSEELDDVKQDIEIDSFDDNEVIDDNFFNISSLELSMTTIKILSKESGEIKSLAKVIGLKTDIKRWNIEHNINEDNFIALVIYIINLIKNRKLNTRKMDNEYINEIYSIVYQKNINIQDIKQKNVSKIDFKNVSFGFLIKNKESWENKINFSSIDDESKMQKNQINNFLKNVSPIVDKLISINSIENNFKNINDPMLYSLIHIWQVELYSIILNKDNVILHNFPLFVFSFSIRSSSEILYLKLLDSKSEDDYYEIKNQLKPEMREYQIKKKVIEFFNANINFKNWLISTKKEIKLIQNNDSNNNFLNISKVFDFFYCDGNKSEFKKSKYINNLKNDIKNMIDNINEIKINKQENEKLLNKYVDDILELVIWSRDFEINGGFRDVLNLLIHNPSLIKTIHFNNHQNSYLKDFSKQLEEKSNIILNLIDFILN